MFFRRKSAPPDRRTVGRYGIRVRKSIPVREPCEKVLFGDFFLPPGRTAEEATGGGFEEVKGRRRGLPLQPSTHPAVAAAPPSRLPLFIENSARDAAGQGPGVVINPTLLLFYGGSRSEKASKVRAKVQHFLCFYRVTKCTKIHSKVGFE